MKTICATVFLMTASTLALAQQTPPPLDAPGPGAGGPPAADRREDGPPADRGDRPPPPRGPGMGGPGRPGMGGPDGRPGGPDGPGMAARNERFEHLQKYLGVVNAYSHLSRDSNQAGIAAVLGAADILRPRGADAGIEYFTKLLPEVKSPAVGRAIRLQLVDLYKAAGKTDEALSQLREVMKAAPETEPTPPARPPQP